MTITSRQNTSIHLTRSKSPTLEERSFPGSQEAGLWGTTRLCLGDAFGQIPAVLSATEATKDPSHVGVQGEGGQIFKFALRLHCTGES